MNTIININTLFTLVHTFVLFTYTTTNRETIKNDILANQYFGNDTTKVVEVILDEVLDEINN